MLLEYFRLHFSQGVILFTLYSFMGWILEVIYRSVSAKKLVNAGFLKGPFTPIYGIGTMILVAISLYAAALSLPLAVLLFASAIILLEFFAGFFIETIFGFKLWDYSENAFNFKGIICPSFSLLWIVMALLFIYVIHPFFYSIIETLPDDKIAAASYIILLYFAADTAFSVAALTSLKKKLPLLFHHYTELQSRELQKVTALMERFIKAFPDLNIYIERNMRKDIRVKITDILSAIKDHLARKDHRREDDAEFMFMAAEISGNREYQRLKTFRHHNTSIYDHILEVAYLTFRISKQLNIDYRSATRGALLHDFFCYDWRNHDLPDLDRKKFHGLHHPRIALENSEKNFTLNDIERDVILKHMWPLTIMPPRYAESFVVVFADKFVASREYSSRFNTFMAAKITEIKKKTGKIKFSVKKIGRRRQTF